MFPEDCQNRSSESALVDCRKLESKEKSIWRTAAEWPEHTERREYFEAAMFTEYKYMLRSCDATASVEELGEYLTAEMTALECWKDSSATCKVSSTIATAPEFMPSKIAIMGQSSKSRNRQR